MSNLFKKTIFIIFIMAVSLWSMKAVYSVFAYSGVYSEADEKIREVETKIQDQQSKIIELKKKAEKYENLIEERQTQIKTLKEQIDVLNNKIAKKELDIEITGEKIKSTQDKVKEKSIEIKQKEKEIVALKEKISSYIRLIYKNDNISYLEILLLNDSFSDFFNYLTFAKDIEYRLKDSLDSVIALKERLETDKDLLEREKLNLKNLKKELEEEKTKLDEEKENKRIILEETKYSEIRFARLLSEAKEEQQQANNDIIELSRQKKKLIAEKEKEKKRLDDATSLSWPVNPSRGISAYFHDPDYPYRYLFEHPAIDIRASQGTPIRAPANGYVGRVRDGGMGYSYIMLIHSNGLSTVYGHVSKIIVQEDQFVERGQIIGYSGGMPGTPGAGRLTSGPHLHFEVRLNGIPVDPLDYLPKIK